MKKIMILAGSLLLAGAITIAWQTEAQAQDSNEIITQIGDIGQTLIENDGKMFRCRCKAGGCYGGNLISFRSLCAKGVGTIDCTAWIMNCPPRES